jgi:hypothetical protein
VIGELSGSTARKQIERIKDGNVQPDKKKLGSSLVSKKGNKIAKPVTEEVFSYKTDELSQGIGSNETQLLEGNETQLLGNETEVLSGVNPMSYGNVTIGVESNVGVAAGSHPKVINGTFEVEKNIVFIHSDEIIV